MAREAMDDHTAVIPYSTGNEQGKFYGVDNENPVFVLFRIYVDETGVGANYYELVNDRVPLIARNESEPDVPALRSFVGAETKQALHRIKRGRVLFFLKGVRI